MEKEIKKPPEKEEGIPWHTAFFEAIQMELDEYSQDLQFISEFPLNTQPLKIDVVIIKKSRDVMMEKNIASIFRMDIKDSTLTFVESHYPREILKHLQEVRGYRVEEKLPGIYIVKGDILPIQIIDNP